MFVGESSVANGIDLLYDPWTITQLPMSSCNSIQLVQYNIIYREKALRSLFLFLGLPYSYRFIYIPSILQPLGLFRFAHKKKDLHRRAASNTSAHSSKESDFWTALRQKARTCIDLLTAKPHDPRVVSIQYGRSRRARRAAEGAHVHSDPRPQTPDQDSNEPRRAKVP